MCPAQQFVEMYPAFSFQWATGFLLLLLLLSVKTFLYVQRNACYLTSIHFLEICTGNQKVLVLQWFMLIKGHEPAFLKCLFVACSFFMNSSIQLYVPFQKSKIVLSIHREQLSSVSLLSSYI